MMKHRKSVVKQISAALLAVILCMSNVGVQAALAASQSGTVSNTAVLQSAAVSEEQNGSDDID